MLSPNYNILFLAVSHQNVQIWYDCLQIVNCKEVVLLMEYVLEEDWLLIHPVWPSLLNLRLVKAI